MNTVVTRIKDGSFKFKNKETATLRFALRDVWFYFLSTSPKPKKGKTFNPCFPAKDSSYEVQVLVSDKKVLKEISKTKSNPDGYTKVTTMVVDKDDFEDQFKCKPPFEADEYHFLKLSRHASYADGATYEGAHYVPVMIRQDGKLVKCEKSFNKAKPHADHEDKKNYDAFVTSPMIGNGSHGHVILAGSWYEFEGEVNQKPIQEQFIIEDLIEYVSSGKSVEVSDDDLAALGLEGMEVVDAPKTAKSEAEHVADGTLPDDDDDDEPLDDPDGEEDFETA